MKWNSIDENCLPVTEQYLQQPQQVYQWSLRWDGLRAENTQLLNNEISMMKPTIQELHQLNEKNTPQNAFFSSWMTLCSNFPGLLLAFSPSFHSCLSLALSALLFYDFNFEIFSCKKILWQDIVGFSTFFSPWSISHGKILQCNGINRQRWYYSLLCALVFNRVRTLQR